MVQLLPRPRRNRTYFPVAIFPGNIPQLTAITGKSTVFDTDCASEIIFLFEGKYNMDKFWIFIATEFYLNSRIVMSLENMALKKEVWEEHPWANVGEDWHAKNAVDGRYEDRSAQGGQCVITENFHKTATWRVDLGSVVSISHIDIHYRTDNLPQPTSYTSRMAGFFLFVSNTTSKEDGHLCFHEIQRVRGTPLEDQGINCSVHGRYVIYYNERNRPSVTYPSYYSQYAYYELCELEVYGCSTVGYYGQNCTIPCSTNCQERRCDVNTGHCLGCVPGYQGPDCSQVCAKQTYGLECSKSCGNCSNGESCHHVNGQCLNGCDVGVQGETCYTECSEGFYGKNCIENCSVNCLVTRRCDRFTGTCDGGCKAGWSGDKCVESCSNAGYYGPYCKKLCPTNCQERRCDVNTGQCLGCVPGYQGLNCSQACPVGFFGMNCVYKCNVFCAGNESCNHVTGLCDEGCKHGWNAPLCGYGGQYSSQSSCDNNLVVICVVVSVVIVLTGSVLNYIFWKRKNERIVQDRNVKETSAGSVKTKTKEKPEETSEQYTELQEVGQFNLYEELKT